MFVMCVMCVGVCVCDMCDVCVCVCDVCDVCGCVMCVCVCVCVGVGVFFKFDLLSMLHYKLVILHASILCCRGCSGQHGHAFPLHFQDIIIIIIIFLVSIYVYIYMNLKPMLWFPFTSTLHYFGFSLVS